MGKEPTRIGTTRKTLTPALNNPHIHTPGMLSYSSSTAGHAHATSMHRMVTVYHSTVPRRCTHMLACWGHANDTQLMQPYHGKYCRVCTAYVGAISIYNYDPDVPF